MQKAFIRFFIGFGVTAFTALAAAQTPAETAAPTTHPLLGVWRSTVMVTPTVAISGAAPLAGKSVACTETMDYRANQIGLTTSGAEITRATYDMSAEPSADGFYRLAQTILEANGKPDCAGDLHSKRDNTLVRFIQFSPLKDQFIVCQSASLASCFGPFRRQTD